MAFKKSPATSDEEMANTYQIKVKGHLDPEWSEWLGDLKINHDDKGNSLLAGHIPDQAALHGILGQIRDLGLTLISIIPENSHAEE